MLGPEAFFPYCQRLLVEQLGLGVASLGELLNHQQDRLVQTYNRHAYLEQKRDALNLWSRHVMDIITPPPENILRLGVR